MRIPDIEDGLIRDHSDCRVKVNAEGIGIELCEFLIMERAVH
jgi:hypothetical protein